MENHIILMQVEFVLTHNSWIKKEIPVLITGIFLIRGEKNEGN